jgi:hypothetical protein
VRSSQPTTADDVALTSKRHCEEPLRRSNPLLQQKEKKLDCFASLAMTASRQTPLTPRRDASELCFD